MNDDTRKVVRRIFSEYISGKGIDTIARHLYNDGIPTPAMVADKSNKNDKWHGSKYCSSHIVREANLSTYKLFITTIDE